MKKLLTIGAVALLAVAPVQANNVTDRRGYIEDIAIAFRRNGLVHLSVTHRHPDINGNRYKAIFAWDCRKKAFYYARSFKWAKGDNSWFPVHNHEAPSSKVGVIWREMTGGIGIAPFHLEMQQLACGEAK